MDFEIRKARDGDRDAVLAFCRRIWLERDYSEHTWSDWQKSAKRMVWIAQRNETPIGIIRGEVISSTEAWMEGLRVDPEAHSRGVGSALYSTLLNELKQIGMTAIRNLTAMDNTPVHRLVEKHGFHRVLCLKRRAKRIETGRPEPKLVQMSVVNTPAVEKFLKAHTSRMRAHSFCTHTGQLYCMDGVHWRKWNDETLRAHLEAGEVWAWRDPALAALAVQSTSAVRPGVWDVGFLEGTREGCRRLLEALAGRETVPPGDAEYRPAVRTFLPLGLSRLQRAASEAGFKADRMRHKPMYLWEWRAGKV